MPGLKKPETIASDPLFWSSAVLTGNPTTIQLALSILRLLEEVRKAKKPPRE
ncbi:hypothetical protein [Olsenella urininfantis]|uniref:hypothetical protein n=1 Tax=Olsenella urininfantis TaxID=1871033 RepID=UPI00135645B7|nr:hypothetical protein [Olsenella urininfantis]